MTQRLEDQEKVVKQVLSQAKVMVEKGIAKVEMNLEPQELGKLELSLVIERDVVNASFVAESKTVQSIIEANLSDLRTALQDAGLKADLLEVGVQTGNFGHREETASAFKQNPSRFYPDYLAKETDEFAMAHVQAWGRVDFRA
jgi:flagellar hook-length control protein FliK